MNPCSSQLHKEDVLMQIRDILRKNNVKLWLQPYYSELKGPSHTDLQVSFFEIRLTKHQLASCRLLLKTIVRMLTRLLTIVMMLCWSCNKTLWKI